MYNSLNHWYNTHTHYHSNRIIHWTSVTTRWVSFTFTSNPFDTIEACDARLNTLFHTTRHVCEFWIIDETRQLIIPTRIGLVFNTWKSNDICSTLCNIISNSLDICHTQWNSIIISRTLERQIVTFYEHLLWSIETHLADHQFLHCIIPWHSHHSNISFYKLVNSGTTPSTQKPYSTTNGNNSDSQAEGQEQI